MSLCVLVTQSCLTLSTSWTVAYQAPLSTEFSRQESWSGLPFPSARHLPNPGTEPESPVSPALQADSLPIEPSGNPLVPLPGIEPPPPTVEAWNPNHWTAREFPYRFSFLLSRWCPYKHKSFFILILSSLSIFVVIAACVLGVISKNPLPNSRSRENLLLCFFLNVL